jgi:hypothetical protein
MQFSNNGTQIAVMRNIYLLKTVGSFMRFGSILGIFENY